MTPAERVNQSSGSAAHTVPFLLSRHAPLRVLPTAAAQCRATPRSVRFLIRVLGSFHCAQTYARRRRLIQWSSSPASVPQRPGRKYPPQPRNRLFSSPTTASRLRPLPRAVSSRTRLRSRRRLSACTPVRVFPMKRVIRKPRYLLCHGLPTALFSSLTTSLSLPVIKRLTERLTRSARDLVGEVVRRVSGRDVGTFVRDYISQEASQLALFEAGGRPPALTSALEQVSDDPDIAGFSAAAENGIPLPAIPEMSQVWGALGLAQVNTMREGEGPAQFTAAAEQIRDAIAG
mgnify:CR=1 FL=1